MFPTASVAKCPTSTWHPLSVVSTLLLETLDDDSIGPTGLLPHDLRVDFVVHPDLVLHNVTILDRSANATGNRRAIQRHCVRPLRFLWSLNNFTVDIECRREMGPHVGERKGLAALDNEVWPLVLAIDLH